MINQNNLKSKSKFAKSKLSNRRLWTFAGLFALLLGGSAVTANSVNAHADNTHQGHQTNVNHQPLNHQSTLVTSNEASRPNSAASNQNQSQSLPSHLISQAQSLGQQTAQRLNVRQPKLGASATNSAPKAQYDFDSNSGSLLIHDGDIGGSDLQKFNGIKNVKSISFKNANLVNDDSDTFANLDNLESFDGSGLNTGQSTDMYQLFANDGNLTKVTGLNNWQTGQIQVMREMFYSDYSLKTIQGINNWNTSNVNDMASMFDRATSLTSLDLGHWNTQNVQSMNAMFYNASDLKNIKGIDHWNTGKVTDMANMFSGAGSLVSLDLGKWNTSHVNYFDTMFMTNTDLQYLNIYNWDTSAIKSNSDDDGMQGMFQGDNSLREIVMGPKSVILEGNDQNGSSFRDAASEVNPKLKMGWRSIRGSNYGRTVTDGKLIKNNTWINLNQNIATQPVEIPVSVNGNQNSQELVQVPGGQSGSKYQLKSNDADDRPGYTKSISGAVTIGYPDSLNNAQINYTGNESNRNVQVPILVNGSNSGKTQSVQIGGRIGDQVPISTKVNVIPNRDGYSKSADGSVMIELDHDDVDGHFDYTGINETRTVQVPVEINGQTAGTQSVQINGKVGTTQPLTARLAKNQSGYNQKATGSVTIGANNDTVNGRFDYEGLNETRTVQVPVKVNGQASGTQSIVINGKVGTSQKLSTAMMKSRPGSQESATGSVTIGADHDAVNGYFNYADSNETRTVQVPVKINGQAAGTQTVNVSGGIGDTVALTAGMAADKPGYSKSATGSVEIGQSQDVVNGEFDYAAQSNAGLSSNKAQLLSNATDLINSELSSATNTLSRYYGNSNQAGLLGLESEVKDLATAFDHRRSSASNSGNNQKKAVNNSTNNENNSTSNNENESNSSIKDITGTYNWHYVKLINDPVELHSSVEFSGPADEVIGTIKLAQHLTLKVLQAVEQVNHGQSAVRLLVKYNGQEGYITGNPNLVQKAYYNNLPLRRNGYRVRILRSLSGLEIHSTRTNWGSHRTYRHYLKSGKTIRALGIVRAGKIYRFAIRYHHHIDYISANRNYVKTM